MKLNYLNIGRYRQIILELGAAQFASHSYLMSHSASVYDSDICLIGFQNPKRIHDVFGLFLEAKSKVLFILSLILMSH